MPSDDDLEGAAKFRRTAETLRNIARQIRFDLRRAAQLRALADGFDRLAERLERHSSDAGGR